MRRIVGPLDRYILGAFLRIFVVTALGFPLLVVIIDATDNLHNYLNQEIPAAKVALSYVYYMPQSLFMVLPASVLFATVFTIGSLTRHSEITAAKASGISFYRLIAPLGVGAVVAMLIGLVVAELTPISTARRNEILGTKNRAGSESRYNFAYASDNGRVYTVGQLTAQSPGRIRSLEIERRGTGPSYPTVVTMANEAEWSPANGWILRAGAVHVLASDSNVMTVEFVALRDYHMTERPTDFLKNPSQPDEMQRGELTRYLRAMQRSGVDVNPTRVDLMLRIAIPATCVIIFLFGAPLATSNQRGGAALGIGIALATTVLFLMLVQLTKAVGGKGILSPEFAAWIPSIVFGAAGIVLLVRVRT